jgi:hypothetical protein
VATLRMLWRTYFFFYDDSVFCVDIW